MYDSVLHPSMKVGGAFQHLPAETFPIVNPTSWLHAHFAVGGWSPLQRLSGMLTAHMSQIRGRSGFGWHPHRGLEIYTWMLEGSLYHEDTTGGSGTIHTGDLQRMFSGEYIEHKELNRSPEQARVIQIWYVAGIEHRTVEPHYQQISGADLPRRTRGDATVLSLIGDDSPMEQHMRGRLTAANLPAGGETAIEPPRPGEDLFLYVTDGSGSVRSGHTAPLGQYDVILARPNSEEVTLTAGESDLHLLSFYLPSFLN